MATETTTKMTPEERILARLRAAQHDRAAGSVTFRVTYTGALADVWRSLREAADLAGLSDSDVNGMLLLEGAPRVRKSIRLLVKAA